MSKVKAWKHVRTSRRSSPAQVLEPARKAARFPWLISTPFGRPVEPEVKNT